MRFSHAIKEKTGIATGTVGMITTPEQAEAILFNEVADLVLLGRELLRNPYFALTSAPKLQVKVAWPVEYIAVQPK
ncbi:MAG: hypothetical protein RRY61_07010 [Bacteroidales bacterium]